ncbi:MAG TPA: DUF488 domain-containing protein [Rhodanobacteraceae bacterium]
MSHTRLPIFTIGHSTRPLADFLALLAESRIACVVDVRSLPGSRAFPQYDADALRASLAQAGIGYAYMPALGGRRGRSLPMGDARNALWHNASFRHYADYACTSPFAEALCEFEVHAARERCVLMCAEAVWWRCHRRIIADHLLARGQAVWHIMAPGKVVPATLTPGARVTAEMVTYPPNDDLFASNSDP